MTANQDARPLLVKLDCHAGVSGDMLAGAFEGMLASSGRARLPLDAITGAVVSAVSTVDAIQARFSSVVVNGFAATHLDMTIEERHDHHGGEVNTIKANLERCIDALQLSGTPSATIAREALDLLATAESSVHGIDAGGNDHHGGVHLHELASADTLVDILLVASAVNELVSLAGGGPVVIHALPVATGTGTVSTAHGILPVPAPGTLAIMHRAGIPFVDGPVHGHELATPTGVALLAALHAVFSPVDMPCKVVATGTGAGTRRYPGVPNVVRATLLEPASMAGVTPSPGDLAVVTSARSGFRCSPGKTCQVTVMIDDASPEVVGHLVEECYTAGALEAYTVPVHGKKARTGLEVTVLCEPTALPGIMTTWLARSTTLGCRVQVVDRVVLDRESRPVHVDLANGDRQFSGTVRVKFLVPTMTRPGGTLPSRPAWKVEHDDVVAVATALGVSVVIARQVLDGAMVSHGGTT